MARALLIANPGASRTRAHTVRAIEQVFTSAGWGIEVLATGGPGDARQLAEYGVQSGVDVVAVFGGDGTTMQAAAALVGTDVGLGLVPGGTGNVLAGNLRLPVNPVRAAAAVVKGLSRRLDLGRVERADGPHYFAVSCGAGIDAQVMAQTPASLKLKWGVMAYVATTIRLFSQISSVPFHVTMDGVEYDVDATMLLVANCGELIPPLMKMGPGISPHDGQLDLIAVQANSMSGGFRAVWDLIRDARGTYGKDVFVARARGADITVECPSGVQPVQLDGDLGGETPFRACVVPGAIRVMHPGG